MAAECVDGVVVMSPSGEMQEAPTHDQQYITTLLKQITEHQEAYAILYNRNLLLYKEWTDAMLCIHNAKHVSPNPYVMYEATPNAYVMYEAAQPPPTASVLCTP